MANDIRDLLRDVVASPLGDIIASVGEGVAEAQMALDEGSLAQTLEIYSEGGEQALQVLRDIGYRPTFYVLPETTGEVSVSMRLGNAAAGSSKPPAGLQPAVAAQLSRIGRNVAFKPRIYATPVDAGYASKFGYQSNISAKLTFKIVPVPAPDGADELRQLPDFAGKTVAQSLELAGQFDLDLIFQDSTGQTLATPDATRLIESQEPSPEIREIVRAGDEILLTLADQ